LWKRSAPYPELATVTRLRFARQAHARWPAEVRHDKLRQIEAALAGVLA
jgi:hypothetical protein